MSLLHTTLQMSLGHTSKRSQTLQSPIWDPRHDGELNWSPRLTFELLLSVGRGRMGGALGDNVYISGRLGLPSLCSLKLTGSKVLDQAFPLTVLYFDHMSTLEVGRQKAG